MNLPPMLYSIIDFKFTFGGVDFVLLGLVLLLGGFVREDDSDAELSD